MYHFDSFDHFLLPDTHTNLDLHLDSTTTPQEQTKKRKRSKNFICSICQKCFYDNSHLKDHIITHTKEKAFLCSICNKPFSRASSLKAHIKSHEKKTIYKCSFEGCNQEYLTKQSLKDHELTHTQLPVIKCLFASCNQYFYTEAQMYRHYRSHIEYKQYKCDFPNCYQTFSSLRSKNLHIRRIHMGDDSNECQHINCQRNRERITRLMNTLKHTRKILQKYRFMLSLLSPRLKRQLHSRYLEHSVLSYQHQAQVVPVQYLLTTTPYHCYFPNCNQMFSSYRKLNKHCFIHHPEVPLESLIQNQIPICVGPKHCPIQQCEYGENKKTLSSLSSLRRHYHRFHSSIS